MRIRDKKREVADFIQYILNWVYREYYTNGNNGFKYELNEGDLAYLMADKSIDKRLEKKLLKKANLKVRATYTFDGLIGILKIKVIDQFAIQDNNINLKEYSNMYK